MRCTRAHAAQSLGPNIAKATSPTKLKQRNVGGDDSYTLPRTF